MRVQALHPDVVVCVSGIWQTTCTLIHSGDEVFVVDSPVLPESSRRCRRCSSRRGGSAPGCWPRTADWDHLLGRLAFPGAALGVAESSARRLRERPGDAQRRLRAFDAEHYVQRGPLALGEVQRCPSPASSRSASASSSCHPAEGHTADGMAIWAPWANVLVCGDYLSPVEDPMVEGDRDEYLATLERLRPLVEEAAWVVPGHGGPLHARSGAGGPLGPPAQGGGRRRRMSRLPPP